MLVVCIAVVSCRKGEPYEIPCIEMYSGGENCDYIDTSLVSNYFLATLRGTHRFCYTDVKVVEVFRSLTPVNTPVMPGKDGVYAHGIGFRVDFATKTSGYFFQIRTNMYSPDTPLVRIMEDVEELSKVNGGYLPIADTSSFETFTMDINFICPDGEDGHNYDLTSNELYLDQRPAVMDSLLEKHVEKGFSKKLAKYDWDEVSSFEDDQYNRWLRIKRFKKVEHDDYYEYDITFEFNLNLYMYYTYMQHGKTVPGKGKDYGYYGPIEGVLRAHFGLKK